MNKLLIDLHRYRLLGLLTIKGKQQVIDHNISKLKELLIDHSISKLQEQLQDLSIIKLKEQVIDHSIIKLKDIGQVHIKYKFILQLIQSLVLVQPMNKYLMHS